MMSDDEHEDLTPKTRAERHLRRLSNALFDISADNEISKEEFVAVLKTIRDDITMSLFLTERDDDE